MIPFLPLQAINASFEPQLSQAVQRVVQSGWYLLGEACKAFEDEYARWLGASHCVGVGSGLDALTLALRAMAGLYHWPDRAEVIVPDMTFVATAEAVVLAGLVPVLAEVDDNALLTVAHAEKVRTARTRAVIPVHLYGHPADMPALCDWAGQHGLAVLEDAAQAHGAEVGGKRVGCWGQAAAFSFYPGKNLGALGDAGCVVTDNEQIAETVRMIGNYGSAEKYVFRYKGRNSRIDEIQAAVLRVKLRYLDADNARRKAIAHRYISEITNDAVVMPPEGGVFHIFAARCGHRDRLMAHLASQGISTMIHYPVPPHKQQAYAEWNTMSLPVTEMIHREEISLPCNQAMTDDECAYVISTINNFMP